MLYPQAKKAIEDVARGIHPQEELSSQRMSESDELDTLFLLVHQRYMSKGERERWAEYQARFGFKDFREKDRKDYVHIFIWASLSTREFIKGQ